MCMSVMQMMAKLPRLNYINIFVLLFSLVLYSVSRLINCVQLLVLLSCLSHHIIKKPVVIRGIPDFHLVVVTAIALVDAAAAFLSKDPEVKPAPFLQYPSLPGLRRSISLSSSSSLTSSSSFIHYSK